MEGLKLYIKESIDELVNNVTWPTWSELVQSTVLVLIASGIFALVVLALDAATKGLLSIIYQ